MPRRTATTRHLDSAPPTTDPDDWPPEGADLLDALVAALHPLRRRLYEVLLMDGPAPVGALAERLGVAPGSVSHHLKPLHRARFVEPAPDLARDTRESWWRAIRRQLSWSVQAVPAGSLGRQVVVEAERANLQHHVDAIVRWMRDRDTLPEGWRSAGLSTDHLVAATRPQVQQLEERLMDVIRDWEAGCRADAEQHPTAERRPVRVIARAFPELA